MKSYFSNREEMYEGYLELRRRIGDALVEFEDSLNDSRSINTFGKDTPKPKTIFQHYNERLCQDLDGFACSIGVLSYLVTEKAKLDHAFIPDVRTTDA